MNNPDSSQIETEFSYLDKLQASIGPLPAIQRYAHRRLRALFTAQCGRTKIQVQRSPCDSCAARTGTRKDLSRAHQISPTSYTV